YPAKDGDKNGHEKDVTDQEEALRKQFDQETERLVGQGEATITNSTNRLNTVSPSVSAAGQSFDNNDLLTDPLMSDLEDSTGIFRGAYDDQDVSAEADSDYAGASLDRKSTTGGCQFLGKRLISWECKKQTIVANSTTEAEYVVAANCCG
ncbi:putative ribonuclease H-like domain-containing protein, partial [Tanacetum coccineum]